MSESPQALRRERGAALVEFALVSLVLYLLLAAAVEFGRLMFTANALQDVARLTARELALTPMLASLTFTEALTYDNPPGCHTSDPEGCIVDVRGRIYDPALLVLDITGLDEAGMNELFAGLPLVNRALRPLMIVERMESQTLLRYPGALLCDANTPTGYAVAIPLVSGEAQAITWVEAVEEMPPGQFSLSGAGQEQFGLAAVRVNYPFQAGMLTGFQPSPPTESDPLPPNISNPISADESFSAAPPPADPGGSVCADDPGQVGTYAGPYGLGRQLAFGGQTVRPFRRVISAQSIYRREVFE